MVMKAKPLYRSLTFWSGIVMLVFIGWAWRMSLVVGSTYFGPRIEARNAMGYVAVEWMPTRPMSHRVASDPAFLDLIRQNFRIHPMPPPAFIRGQDKPGFPGLSVDPNIPDEQKPFFHPVWQEAHTHDPRGNYLLLMPHWLLMLAVAVVWGGLLLWRTRRMRAAKVSLTAP